jgi:hypothetical protein
MAPSTTQNNLQALSSSSSKTKHQDQKAIQEKIAKVREVVKNASTNDVVLALHNFGLLFPGFFDAILTHLFLDMNVEQTIHAFCEGFFLFKTRK